MAETFNKSPIAYILLLIFCFGAVALQLLPLTDDQMNMYKAVLGLICFMYAVYKCPSYILANAFRFGAILSILMTLEILVIGSAKWVNIIWIWAYIGPALLLFYFGLPRLHSFILFYTVSIYFVYLAFTGSIEINEVLVHGSSNYVSILTIFCMSVYLLSFREVENKELPYIPILLVLFLSIWTASRASLICGGIFIIYVLYLNHESADTRAKKTFFYVLVILMIISVIWFLNRYLDTFNQALEYKMDRQGMESARSVLWKEYTGAMFDSITQFLFGVDGMAPEYKNLNYYGGNPHNSFLMLHEKFGIGGFVYIIYFLMRSLKKAYRRKDHIIASILLLVSFRCFFDWNAFPGLYDVLFWYMVFYSKHELLFHEKSIIKYNWL